MGIKMNPFNELCKKLAIDSSNASQQSLEKLIKYCQTYISQDRVFKGSLEQQFIAYRDLVTLYIETVLPNLNENDLCQNVSELNNMSSLEYLVRAGFDRCIEKLKPQKNQINTLFGLMSPLNIAASYGFQHTTRVLLELGAEPTLKNKQNEMPINYALRLPVLHNGELRKSKQTIFIELYKLAPETIAQQTIDGSTVTHQMAVHGYTELLSWVIEKKPELTTISNNQGNLPIHDAILNGQMAAVQVLLKGGDAERMVDFHERNPLHYAALYGDKEMIELCSTAVNNIELPDKDERTPLMLAAYNGNLVALKFLLQVGADPSKKDKSGQNALQISIDNNQLDIAECLLKLANGQEPLSEHHQSVLELMRQQASNNNDSVTSF